MCVWNGCLLTLVKRVWSVTFIINVAHITTCSIQVLVKTIAKVEYSVQCSKDQTVLDVKTALEVLYIDPIKHGLTPFSSLQERGAGNASDMKLLDAGHALDDETKITDVDVVTRDGGFVVLMNIPKRKKPSKRPHRQGCEKAADTSSDKRATDLPKQGPVPMGPPRSMIAPGPPIVAGKNETLESYARDAERCASTSLKACPSLRSLQEIPRGPSRVPVCKTSNGDRPCRGRKGLPDCSPGVTFVESYERGTRQG